jgi:hypothetical protein
MKVEYPKERLYLRVGNLLTSLKDYTIKEGNLELYAYLLTISRSIKPDDIDVVIKTEKHILSKNFLYQRDFNDKDRDYMIPIIRDYKLKEIGI